jgi:hypothetical protein
MVEEDSPSEVSEGVRAVVLTISLHPVLVDSRAFSVLRA